MRVYRVQAVGLLLLALVFACKLGGASSTASKAGASGAAAVYAVPQPPWQTSSSGVPGVQAAWTELGPGTAVIARAVTTAACPLITINGTQTSMAIRSSPSTAYDVTVCELTLPPNTLSATIGAQSLRLPVAQPRRILIIGDTGCRMKLEKDELQLQDCNNLSDWPLATVAASAAAAQADLIIHVGDYHYRESPCPAGNAECAGAIAGDVWGSWQQDFFGPALPLLEAAPILFVRGNHELCARAGNGWFTFLDPRVLPSTCTDSTNPYWVTVGDHQIAVIDSADDKNEQPSFNSLQPLSNTLVWWVLHRPFLTPGADDELTGPAPQLPSVWGATPGLLNGVFTGHEHRLAYNHFTNRNWPPEMINGNGATYLDNETVAGQTYDNINQPSYQGFEWFNYGFVTLDRTSTTAWTMTPRNQNGNPVINCTMTEAINTQTNLSCTPLAGASVQPAARPPENVPAASTASPITSTPTSPAATPAAPVSTKGSKK